MGSSPKPSLGFRCELCYRISYLPEHGRICVCVGERAVLLRWYTENSGREKRPEKAPKRPFILANKCAYIKRGVDFAKCKIPPPPISG